MTSTPVWLLIFTWSSGWPFKRTYLEVVFCAFFSLKFLFRMTTIFQNFFFSSIFCAGPWDMYSTWSWKIWVPVLTILFLNPSDFLFGSKIMTLENPPCAVLTPPGVLISCWLLKSLSFSSSSNSGCSFPPGGQTPSCGWLLSTACSPELRFKCWNTLLAPMETSEGSLWLSIQRVHSRAQSCSTPSCSGGIVSQPLWAPRPTYQRPQQLLGSGKPE